MRSDFIGSGPHTLWTIVHATVLVEEFPFCLVHSMRHTPPLIDIVSSKRDVVKNPQERGPARAFCLVRGTQGTGPAMGKIERAGTPPGSHRVHLGPIFSNSVSFRF